MVLEMFLWAGAEARAAFGTTEEFAAATKTPAANQGLYDGFLAAGLVWSAVASDPGGFQAEVFFLMRVAVVGAYGAATASRKVIFVWTLPALAALAQVLAAHRAHWPRADPAGPSGLPVQRVSDVRPAHPELPEDLRRVPLDGARRQHLGPGDLLVGRTRRRGVSATWRSRGESSLRRPRPTGWPSRCTGRPRTDGRSAAKPLRRVRTAWPRRRGRPAPPVDRVFTGPDDFNTQLTAWLQIANRRRYRSTDARPIDRWEADRAAILTVPPVVAEVSWRPGES
ncbi:hypothetical protein GCM10020229_71250 [Kitasatospora albolonga]